MEMDRSQSCSASAGRLGGVGLSAVCVLGTGAWLLLCPRTVSILPVVIGFLTFSSFVLGSQLRQWIDAPDPAGRDVGPPLVGFRRRPASGFAG